MNGIEQMNGDEQIPDVFLSLTICLWAKLLAANGLLLLLLEDSCNLRAVASGRCESARVSPSAFSSDTSVNTDGRSAILMGSALQDN
jgi:hypothetical protein